MSMNTGHTMSLMQLLPSKMDKDRAHGIIKVAQNLDSGKLSLIGILFARSDLIWTSIEDFAMILSEITNGQRW